MNKNRFEMLHSVGQGIVFSITPVLLVLFLIYDMNLSGVRNYNYSFDRQSVSISSVFPAQRLAGIQNGSQAVLQEPVYFTVRYPHTYDTATIRIDVKNTKDYSWTVGLQVNNDEWAYDIKTPDSQGTVSFDLSHAKVTDRTIRFLIGINSQEIDDFSINNIHVRLEKNEK